MNGKYTAKRPLTIPGTTKVMENFNGIEGYGYEFTIKDWNGETGTLVKSNGVEDPINGGDMAIINGHYNLETK